MTFRYFRKQRLGTVQMGHVPPYIIGGYVLPPLFGWDAFISGVSQLPQTLNLNGVDITASTFYVGDDSTGATWPSRNGAGSTLGLTGAGTDPVAGEITAFSDGTTSVKYATATSKGNIAPDTTTAELGAQNTVIVLHYYHSLTASAAGLAARKTSLGAGDAGWNIRWNSTTAAALYFSDGVTQRTFTLTVAYGWNTIVVILNSATSATWGMRNYLNGTFISAAARPANTMDTGPALRLGNDVAAVYDDRIALFAIYKGAFLPDDATATTIMNNIGAEIAQRLDGTWPQYAGGSRVRSASPRTTGACAIVEDGSDIVAQFVGTNFSRVCRASGLAPGVGFLSEKQITNIILRSDNLGHATWTKLNGTIAATQVVGPDKLNTLDAFSSTAVMGVHGVEQAPTMAATTTTVSCFMRAGVLSWGYLDVSTIANVSCYFDLANGVAGTVGAAVLGYGMEQWTSTLWRVWITFTGVVGAQNVRALTATGDGGIVHAGGNANEMDLGWFQGEASARATSPVRNANAIITRNGDVLYFDGAGNYPAGGLTTVRVAVNIPPSTPKVSRVLWNDTTGGASPQDFFGINITTGRINTQGYNPALQWNLTGSVGAALNAVDDNVPHVMRTTMEVNNIALYLDGVLATPIDVAASVPAGMTRIHVGGQVSAANSLNGVVLSGKIYDQIVAPGEQGTGNDT